MTTMQQPIKGKYGYYAADYETFRALKAYHGALLRAFRQFRAYQRWAAKKGSNRVRRERVAGQLTGVVTPMERPSYPEALTTPMRWPALAWTGEGDATLAEVRGLPQFREYRGENLYRHVLAVYRKARRPAATPEEVEPLDLPDGWERHLAELIG